MADFEIPSWLRYADIDTIHNRMLLLLKSYLPNIDCSEGSFFWDFTRPWASERSRMIQFNLTEAVKNIFPQYAYGSTLDEHAADRLMSRRNPIYAFGVIKIEGQPGAIVEKGTIVMTTSPEEGESVSFETLERVTIPPEGFIEVEIRAMEPGANGNVGANTITALQVGRNDITSITNEVECSGGADTESDEALRERIQLYDQRTFSSFVGTERDYQIWALEVPGVGSARVEGCLDRTGDGGDGIVHITITDSEGRRANERLKQAVYDHIMSPDDPERKLAAVNSKLIIESPEMLPINISVDILMEESFNFGEAIETLEDQFKEAVENYILSTLETGIIYRREIGAILINLYGIADYENLTLNGERKNIIFTNEQIPALGEVTIGELS